MRNDVGHSLLAEMATSQPSTAVKSAMRTLDIMEFVVARGQGVVAQEIAETLAIPVSSLSYLLSTLVDRGYLVRDGRRYRAGPGLQRLATSAEPVSIKARAAPLIRHLKAQLNETCSFMTIAGWEVEASITEDSNQALRYAIHVGIRRPLHCMAAGKAILAAMPEADLSRYFAETERVRFTDATLIGEQELRAELERVRNQGYAEAFEESQLGVVGLAYAVEYERNVLGAVAVAVPTVRYDEQLRSVAIQKLLWVAEQLRVHEV